MWLSFALVQHLFTTILSFKVMDVWCYGCSLYLKKKKNCLQQIVNLKTNVAENHPLNFTLSSPTHFLTTPYILKSKPCLTDFIVYFYSHIVCIHNETVFWISFYWSCNCNKINTICDSYLKRVRLTTNSLCSVMTVLETCVEINGRNKKKQTKKNNNNQKNKRPV